MWQCKLQARDAWEALTWASGGPHRLFPFWSQHCGWTGPCVSYNCKTPLRIDYQGTLEKQGLLLMSLGRYSARGGGGPGHTVRFPGRDRWVCVGGGERERERGSWGFAFIVVEGGVPGTSWFIFTGEFRTWMQKLRRQKGKAGGMSKGWFKSTRAFWNN